MKREKSITENCKGPAPINYKPKKLTCTGYKRPLLHPTKCTNILSLKI